MGRYDKPERDEQLRRADHDKLALHESMLEEKDDRIRSLDRHRRDDDGLRQGAKRRIVRYR